MRKTIPLARGIVVITAVLTSVLVLPSPASATTFVNNGTGTSGSLYITKTGRPPFEIPLSGPPTMCPSSTVEVDVTPTATPPASFDITDLHLQSLFLVPPGTTYYVAVMTRTASTAGISGSINPITGSGLSMRLDVFTVTGTCTPGSMVCRFTMNFAVTGTHSGFPVTSSNTTVVLEGALTNLIHSINPPCSVPMALYIGGQAQFAFMGFELI